MKALWVAFGVLASTLVNPGRAAAPLAAQPASSASASSVFAGALALTADTVFLPLPTQFRLGLRTVAATTASATTTLTLDGVVVRDPNASGVVQASQPGVLSAPAGGFPELGQRVTRGQALAVLRPTLDAIERGRLEAETARIDKELALNQKLLERVREQAITGGINISIQQETTLIEYQGLLKQRAALERTLGGRSEILRAPVAGVVGHSVLALGKVAAKGDVLVELVDPDRLRIEAPYHDPTLGARLAAVVALTPGGKPLALRFIGQGAQWRNQSVPLLFAVPPVSGLALGQPLRLEAQLAGAAQTGAGVPDAALVRRAGTAATVWVKTAAERFSARPVKVLGRSADGWVVSGVKPGERVVAVGANALGR
jgi:biotin carboxyl carrier protein